MKLIFPITSEGQLNRLKFEFLDQSIFAHQLERLKLSVDTFIEKVICVVSTELGNCSYEILIEEAKKVFPDLILEIVFSDKNTDAEMLSELSDEFLEGNILLCPPLTIVCPEEFKIERVKDFQLFIYTAKAQEGEQYLKINDFGEIVDYLDEQPKEESRRLDAQTYYFKNGLDFKVKLNAFLAINTKQSLATFVKYLILEKKEKPYIKEIHSCYKVDFEDFFDFQSRFIQSEYEGHEVKSNVQIKHSVLIEPVFIDEGCIIENSVIGPNVSIGKDVKITHSIISNSLLRKQSCHENVNINLMFIENDMTSVLFRDKAAIKS